MGGMFLKYYLAIDIGASSGRHILGHVYNGRMILEEVYRFDNRQIFRNGHDCWDMDNLWYHILAGMKVCGVYDASSEEYAEEIKAVSEHYIRDFAELLTL